eukprot:scaffold17553_cov112-Isochrysis_galbana.AAC.4
MPHSRQQTRFRALPKDTAAMTRGCARARGHKPQGGYEPQNCHRPGAPLTADRSPNASRHATGPPKNRKLRASGSPEACEPPQHPLPPLSRFWLPPLLAPSRQKAVWWACVGHATDGGGASSAGGGQEAAQTGWQRAHLLDSLPRSAMETGASTPGGLSASQLPSHAAVR